MSTPRDQYVAFQRFGFGARPGDRAAIADDPRGAVLAEIVDRNAAQLLGSGLPTATEGLIEQYKSAAKRREFREEAARQGRLAANAPTPSAGGKAKAGMARDMGAGDGMSSDMASGGMASGDMGGMSGGGMAGGAMAAAPKRTALEKPKLPDDPSYRYARDTYLREIESRIARARSLRVGYVERLVAFWTNHFTVEADKGQRMRAIIGAYEREAIRPHVLGRFRDMLGAMMRHPAMLIYLDNFRSVGPNSVYGLARGEGLNENMAREALELHTLGVGGGYTQEDVTSFANILTGWTLQPLRDPQNAGVFLFSAMRHEPGEHRLLGRAYPPNGIAQGEAALDALARHPSTARHIATRLATSFVADDPPPALVDRLAAVFRETDGDLGAVARALATDDAAWAAPSSKLRLPSEYLLAGMRALALDLDGSFAHRVLRGFGEEPWNATSPQGFGIKSADWIAPDALTNRLDLAEVLAIRADPGIDPRALLADMIGETASRETTQAIARAESPQQGIALFLMSPEFQRR